MHTYEITEIPEWEPVVEKKMRQTKEKEERKRKQRRGTATFCAAPPMVHLIVDFVPEKKCKRFIHDL